MFVYDVATLTELSEVNPGYVGEGRLGSQPKEYLLELGQLGLDDVPALLLFPQVFDEARHFPVVLVVFAAFRQDFLCVLLPIFKDTSVLLEDARVYFEFGLLYNYTWMIKGNLHKGISSSLGEHIILWKYYYPFSLSLMI